MHIERLEIETFGGLVQVTIADLGRGVQVLHGTNEVGKTSLLEFVRAIFFGFEGLFRRGVLDPQVPCSGRLVVAIGRGPRCLPTHSARLLPNAGSLPISTVRWTDLCPILL